jgi:uncharacterized iron-regulated protein
MLTVPPRSIILIVIAGGLLSPPIRAQDATHRDQAVDSAYVAGEYRVFTGSGDVAALQDVVTAMQFHEVVFLGETHDDPTAHLLELELLSQVDSTLSSPVAHRGTERDVTLSVEFFQRDVQGIVDEYVAGLISEGAFLEDVRPWPRYGSDYRHLVEYAKAHGIRILAANAPRRYVNRVGRLGRKSLEGLSAEAQLWLPPLPYGDASNEYRDQWVRAIMDVAELERDPCGLASEDSSVVREVPAEHPSTHHHADMGNQLDAQLLWDATMAYAISDYLLREPDNLIIHIVGSFHVERGTGTPEFLERYRPGTSSMTVIIRPVADIETFEPAPDGQWGDFVIQTDRSRTLTEIECAITEGQP